jgi:metal-responsive CopG/Arc/MetJ family transcriptional regulator
MKTAVSLPDEVFESAERLAKRTRKSRSQLFSDALREYVSRHADDEVTAAMDHALEALGTEKDADSFSTVAARAALGRSEW